MFSLSKNRLCSAGRILNSWYCFKFYDKINTKAQHAQRVHIKGCLFFFFLTMLLCYHFFLKPINNVQSVQDPAGGTKMCFFGCQDVGISRTCEMHKFLFFPSIPLLSLVSKSIHFGTTCGNYLFMWKAKDELWCCCILQSIMCMRKWWELGLTVCLLCVWILLDEKFAVAFLHVILA